MEGSQSECSDSDSGESWTLLDASPSYAATPSPCPSPAVSAAASNGDVFDGADRDEDTDGISIISDSESESIAACELALREDLPPETARATPHLAGENVAPVLITQEPINAAEPNESVGCDDFLEDSPKMKIYVHRRNKKVSSMLNVIMLGSMITAAGIALGHIWGVRDDCSLHTTPSVNKILSNLYKLQEENAFLRSKLKELTLAGQFQLQQKKTQAEKLASAKLNKCRKVFEEPLHSANIVKTTKCMDLEPDMQQPDTEFEKTELTPAAESIDDSLFESAVDEVEFKGSINKLKQIYKENRNWLDAEVARRLKDEDYLAKLQDPKKLNTLSNKRNPKGEQYECKDKNNVLVEKNDNLDQTIRPKELQKAKEINSVNIVSYADSVKYGHVAKDSDDEGDIRKREDREIKSNQPHKNKYRKRHEKREAEVMTDDDDEVTEDRYSANKHKYEQPKQDRQKSHRKYKRENKYEQWQMKGGYMKDYESVESLSSQESAKLIKDYVNNRLSREWERVNYMDQFADLETKTNKEKTTKGEPKTTRSTTKSKIDINASDDSNNKSVEESADVDWFEKRSILRRQARADIEEEVPKKRKFLKSNSRWYFRRMSERERLRTNDTGYKATRRNFKTRH